MDFWTENLQISGAYGAFIDNAYAPITATTFIATCATTGQYLAQVSRCGADEMTAAIASATAAHTVWKTRMPQERAACLSLFADLLEDDAERLKRIDRLDTGRRLGDIDLYYTFAIQQYRHFAAAIQTYEGWKRSIPAGHRITDRAWPGVCGHIVPLNVPSIMAAFNIAPAVAAGYTVVLKPDESASLSALELGKLLAKCFPPGIVNIVPGLGEEVGCVLTGHPDVAKLAFTGGPEADRMASFEGRCNPDLSEPHRQRPERRIR